jgi:thiol-disulfide isomerase/thioredoxin
MRKSTIRLMILGVIIFIVVLAGLTGCSSAVSGVPEVGKKAPDFSYPDAAGNTVSLSELSDKVVMINFWATWCGPCRSEMPVLDALAQDQEKAAQGLVFLSVNTGETQSTVQTYMESNGYSFPVILDSNGAIATKYNIRYLPTTFFIGRDGLIRSIKSGAFSSASDLLIPLNAAMK